MARIHLHVLVDFVENLPAALARAEEVHVLPPPERDHDADAVFVGEIEEPLRRRVVDADAVDADLTHHREVATRLFDRPDVKILRVRRKRATGDPFRKNFWSPSKKNLARVRTR